MPAAASRYDGLASSPVGAIPPISLPAANTLVMPLPSLPLTRPTVASVTEPAAIPAAATQSAPTMPQAVGGNVVLNKVADEVEAVAGPSAAQEVTAGLLRPLIQTPSPPPAGMHALNPTVSVAAAPTGSRLNSTIDAGATPSEAYTLDTSLLTRPFEMTNSGAPPRASIAAAGTADQQRSPDVWNNPLVRQFAMSKGEDLRKPPTDASAPIAPPVSTDSGNAWALYTPSGPAQHARASRTGNAGQSGNDGTLVGFMQDAALEPIPDPADLDATAGQAAGGKAGGQGDSLAQADKLGNKPEDNTLEFLRTQTVLLKPGDSQCDVGLNYFFTDTSFPVLLTDGTNIVGVTDASFRVRQLTVPIEYRTGLTKRVQGFIGAPIGWSNTQLTFAQFEDFRNDGGLGDLNFGLTMQLKDAAVDCPYWVATVSGTAPTGGDPFTGIAGLAPSAPSLGQGFWSLTGTLLFIQPYDPVVLFYGLGMEHFFPHDYIGAEFNPGNQYNYTFGVGFAVNDRVTLSGRFRGTYQDEIEVNGRRILDTNTEPISLRFSATISRPCDRIVEPFVEFGLTDAATDVFFGVTWTFSRISHPEDAKTKPASQDGGKQ